MFFLKIIKELGEPLRQKLKAEKLINDNYQFLHEEGLLLIPLNHGLTNERIDALRTYLKEKLGIPYTGKIISDTEMSNNFLTLIEKEGQRRRYPRLSPYERICRFLEIRGFPSDVMPGVPTRWEVFGDVVIISLIEMRDIYLKSIAEAFQNVLGMRSVFVDRTGIAGEFREPNLERIIGDDPVTTHVENGIKYTFDVEKIMFSSGNIDERIRFSTLDSRGQIIVDMFAGIGYFTLPLAMYSKPEHIYALEKNPVAIRYLKKNLKDNKLDDVVTPILGDNRDYSQINLASRIIMGYLPTPESFISKALGILKDDGGIIHYHHTVPVIDRSNSGAKHHELITNSSGNSNNNNINNDMNYEKNIVTRDLQNRGTRDIVRQKGKCQTLWSFIENLKAHPGKYNDLRVSISDYRIIKSYAPKVFHCVADVSLKPK